nr:MAG TPA: hypothetical protein [Caudoviricetes sp.]
MVVREFGSLFSFLPSYYTTFHARFRIYFRFSFTNLVH